MYGQSVVFMAVFVDDLLIASANMAALSFIKQRFMRRFTMTDIGPAREFLGVRIIQHDKFISLISRYTVSRSFRSTHNL